MPPELYKASKITLSFLGKHSVVFYISFILLALAGAIGILYLIIQTTFNPALSSASSIQGFDEKTIAKVKDLRDSSTGESRANLPCPRPDPFVEAHVPCIYLISIQLASFEPGNSAEPLTADTLCTFVKSRLNGPNCTTTSSDYADEQGKSFTVGYHLLPQSFSEAGYWDSSVCSDKSPNGFTHTSDTSRSVFISKQANQTMLCINNS